MTAGPALVAATAANALPVVEPVGQVAPVAADSQNSIGARHWRHAPCTRAGDVNGWWCRREGEVLRVFVGGALMTMWVACPLCAIVCVARAQAWRKAEAGQA